MPFQTKRVKSAPVGVIGKVLRILELLDQSPAGLPLREVAARTGMNKSTVHRFVSHLEAEAYLFRDDEGTYMLGPKLVRLGSAVNFQATICNVSRPALERLREVTDETVNLAVLDGHCVLFLDVLDSLHTFRSSSEVGMRCKVHTTSLGKAILARMDDDPQKEAIFASIPLTRETAKSITSLARLKRELAQTRERGYALDDEEAVAGVRGIGAAICGSDGKVLAAISISGPTSRVNKARLPFLSGEISKAAREISWSLGCRSPKQAKKRLRAIHPTAKPRAKAARRG